MLNRIGKLFSPTHARDSSPRESAAVTFKEQGNEHLAKGELDDALACYRKAVAIAPDYAEAFNNLGFVCIRQGRDEEAEQYLDRAVALNPELANAHYNRATLLRNRCSTYAAVESYRRALSIADANPGIHRELGSLLAELDRNEEALASLRRAVDLDPDHFRAHHDLGLVCQRLGRLEEACESLSRAVRLERDSALAHYNLAMVLRQLGRLQEAAASLYRTIALSPDFAEAYFQLANLLHATGEPDTAVLYFEKALALKEDYPDAHNNLGLIFVEREQLDAALGCFRKALAIKPDHATAHLNISKVLHTQGRFDEALASADAAIALNTTATEAFLGKALVLKGQARLDEALECLRRASELDTKLDATGFAMSTTLLEMGKLAEGWELYRHRFFPGSPAKQRPFGQAQWNGKDLQGKTLLLWGDQGIGDQLLFANMIPELIASAERCIIECNHKLVPLFASSFPGAIVVPQTDPPHPATREHGIDFQIAVADTARWLRPDIDSFPRHEGYLFPDPARVAYWKKRVAEIGTGPKIGICWRSSVRGSYRDLHYTRLDQWGPIFAVPDVHFVSLQYDECAEELEAARQRFGVPLHVFPEVDLYNDLHEAAALTKAMDLMIGAGTTATTLASVQGVPTWGLGHGTDWMTHGTDHVPWFPSERLFMRRWDQPWEEIIAIVAERLQARLIP